MSPEIWSGEVVLDITRDAEITGHWLSYLKGAFALANVFGPEWTSGRRHERPAGNEMIDALTIALAEATVQPPTLSAPDAALIAATGAQLWQVFDAAADARIDDAVELTNALLAQIAPRPALTRHGPAGNWHLHFTAAAHGEGHRWASDVIVAVAMLLGSEAFEQTGRCCAERCERVYMDQTRNHSQRFCSTQCQERTKTAARRRRRRELALTASSRSADGNHP